MAHSSSALRLFPFAPGGAAADMPLPHGRITLTDLSAKPRFGIKGPGTADWLTAQGLALPAINHIGTHDGMRVLRLGTDDVLFLAEESAASLGRLTGRWREASGARGYSAWREEGWVWLRLSGADAGDLMARLCAVDLRPDRFAPDRIAQTRVASIEAVVTADRDGFDLLFDTALAAFFVRALDTAEIARQAVLGDGGDKPSAGHGR